MLHETLADMGGEVTSQRLLAGDEGKAAGQLLGHKPSSLSYLIFARVRDEILHDEFPGRNTSNCNRSFHHGQDDLWERRISDRCAQELKGNRANLANSAFDGKVYSPLEIVIGCQRAKLWVDHHVQQRT